MSAGSSGTLVRGMDGDSAAAGLDLFYFCWSAGSIVHGVTGLPRVTAICFVCGRDVAGLRSDALYCSNACRQRAYRARKAATS